MNGVQLGFNFIIVRYNLNQFFRFEKDDLGWFIFELWKWSWYLFLVYFENKDFVIFYFKDSYIIYVFV